jgi:glucan phosphoethanolaminetransferase (alkaline phosphatase superfamily)
MTLELIIFIASILFGAVIFWRESQGNKVYRFFNKLMNSKELQMVETDTKGFVYQQSFLLRLVFITALFLVVIVITRFLIPIDLATISLFASMIFGTLIGTYVAGFVFKSSAVIEEQSESLEDKFQDVIEKGKDFIEDLQAKDVKEIEEVPLKKETPKAEEKSARERLKDKGFLK